jgi:hypothetical protein
MKGTRWVVYVLFVLGVFAGLADAQKKPVRKTTPVKNTTIAPLDVRAAREKVQIQHDNVNFWIDKLSDVAVALEVLDKSDAAKPPSAARLATHERRKKEFIQTLRNLREDLLALESEFRTKPALQKYLPSIQGVTDLAAQAEDSATAGKFSAFKPPLLQVLGKLTDTLAIVPR